MCQNKEKHRDGEEESGSESLVKGGECAGEALVEVSVFKLVWGVGEVQADLDSALGVRFPLRIPILLPGALVVKHPPADAGDGDSIPASGRSPGEENGNPLQHSFLENSMDRGAWQAIVHKVAKSQTRLSDLTQTDSTSPRR